MASRWQARHSPRLTRSPLRTSLPYSPLKTPPMRRTPPLLSAAALSPLKTPPLFSNFSPPPVSHTPPLFSDASWRTEPDFHYDLRWVSDLSPIPAPSPPRPNIMVPAGINPAIVPTTMREVDHFLSSAWNDVCNVTSTSEYSRKLSELHRFYTSKMGEIEAKERRSLAESLSSGDQPGPSGLNTLGDCLLDAEIKEKYSKLKRNVKEETVQAILKLKAKSPSPPKRNQGNSSSPQQQRSSPQQQSPPKHGNKTTRAGKSPKRTSPKKPSRTVWDTRTLDILNTWFDEHSDKPYPTKKEKEELAQRCKMTTKQISTWFNNKRYRSNCTLTKKGTDKGKGKGKGSK